MGERDADDVRDENHEANDFFQANGHEFQVNGHVK